jgi:hypothetical protein
MELSGMLTDRTASHELIFPITQMAFERPGTYEFRLFADPGYIGGMILTVLQVNEPQGGPNE